ncbi:ASCH domain-containing protein [Patescibacteria group bacterium]|nr:ASCH domain-containing protein [Patescibacteria group bacterium]
MTKRLRFSDPLPELVLKGEKDITWRINDDKDLSVGDELSLCRMDNIEYAKAEITWIKETTFGALTKEDKEGHEKFNSEQELYATYSKYYSTKVTPETPLKVIKFRLL